MNNSLKLVGVAVAALAAAAMVLALDPTPAALAQGSGGAGVIDARVVISGSTSTNGLSNLPVSMFTYVNGQRQATPAVGSTDAQGRARFEGLVTTDGYTYTVIVRYQDNFYRVEHVAFPAGASSVSAVITVPPAAAAPAGDGVLEARVVVSGSADTASLANLSASLFAFTGGAHPANSLTGLSDAQGRFRFDSLATGSNVTYTLVIQYQGMSFDSGTLAFPPGGSLLTTTIKVPQVSTDASRVRILQHHVVVDVNSISHTLQIAEFFLTTSGSSDAYIGEPDSTANNKRVTMRVPLPPNALVDGIDQRTIDQNVFLVGNSLLDGMPIPPSGGSLIISYQVPFDRATLALAFSAPYSTTTLNLLLAPGIGVHGQRLVDQGNVPDTKFKRYSAGDLPAGYTLAVELTDLPAPLIPLDLVQWAPLALAATALTALLIFAGRRRTA